jgi:murein DD-endopeptidase MepM/ murein hydrolase activator NlpD
MNFRGALCVLVLLALAACGYDTGSGSNVTVAPPPATAPLGPGQTYTVIAGDTVDSIAQQFGVSVDTLIQANRLPYPYSLQKGQKLVIPGQGSAAAPADYEVVSGDTLSRIARQHGTTVATLAQLNGLAPPYTIKIGQRLHLPGGAPTEMAASGGVTELPPSMPAPPLVGAGSSSMTTEALPPPPDLGSAQPVAGSTAQPAPSTTAGTVAAGSAAGAAAAGTAAAGTGSSQTPATSGGAEVATLPPPELQPAAPSVPTTTGGAASGSQPAGAAAPSAGNGADNTAVLEAPPQAPAEVPAPAPRGSGKFLWPVNGKVVSAFGVKDGGLHNDGINIAAPLGTPIKAAENGTVVYAGNELRGFGNLLLIRHADGWVTAYAHCEAFLVKRGDQVKRGQVVARVGQTGNVTSPQLHFELRKGSQAVDPMGELGPQGA